MRVQLPKIYPTLSLWTFIWWWSSAISVLRNEGWQRGKPQLWKGSTCRAALPLCPPHLFYSLECQKWELKHCYYLFCSDPHVAALKPALYHLETMVGVSIATHGKALETVLCPPSPRVAWFTKAASHHSIPPQHVPAAIAHSPINSSGASTARGRDRLGNKALVFCHSLRFIPVFKSFAISKAAICNREFQRAQICYWFQEKLELWGWDLSSWTQLQNQFFAGFLRLLSFKLKAFLFNASLMKLAFVRGYGNILLCENFRVSQGFKKSQFCLCWWESGSDLNPFCSEALHLLFLNLKMVWILLKLIWLSCQRKRLFPNAPYSQFQQLRH